MRQSVQQTSKRRISSSACAGILPLSKANSLKALWNVVVSLGAKGALLLEENGQALFCRSVRGEAVSTVGAGDSLVAGFLYGYELHGSALGGLKWGVAAGAATAFCEGIATGDQVKAVFPRVGEPHPV